MQHTPIVLSVIIVSYNTSSFTRQTIASVLADISATPSLKSASEIIVIDNASSDDSVSAVRTLSQSSAVPIHLIENSENVGFAQANNQGMAAANGTYYFLLNSDTIVQPGALQTLVEFYQTHPLKSSSLTASTQGRLDTVGIVAATLLNADGTIQPQGGSLPTLPALMCHMWMLDDLPLLGKFLPSTQHTGLSTRGRAHHRPYQMGWVGGTALLISKQTVAEIGMLDDAIFMYAEDIEWCMRAHDHHLDVVIHPEAQVVHLQNKSGSSEKAIVGEFKGYRYLWSKHKPLWQQPLVVFILKSGAYLRQAIYSLLGNTKQAKVYSTIAHTIR